jgi:hypothetical protein
MVKNKYIKLFAKMVFLKQQLLIKLSFRGTEKELIVFEASEQRYLLANSDLQNSTSCLF